MNEGELIFHPTMIDFRFIDLYNIFIIFLQSSKMYLILSENIDLYYLISNNYLNTHFILLLVLYVSELWIVGFSNYQVIDALANHGVAPIGQEQVLSKNQSRSMGKNEKTCFLREFLEFPQITFGWYVDENTTWKYHISLKSYYRKFRKFAKKSRFVNFSPYLEMGLWQYLLLADRSHAMVR